MKKEKKNVVKTEQLTFFHKLFPEENRLANVGDEDLYPTRPNEDDFDDDLDVDSYRPEDCLKNGSWTYGLNWSDFGDK